MKYRMYIDEVGNSDLQASKNPNHRYLSLTGLIFEHERKPLPVDVNGQMGQILEDSKYDRSPSGRIDGWGRKWLP